VGPALSGRPAPFGFRRVVFLSHVLGPGTPVFPGDPAVALTTAATVEQDGYYLQRLACGEQSGTHWAAPAHFDQAGLAADELDAADFFFPAVVLDLREQAEADRDYAVGVSDFSRWEAAHGEVPSHAAVLLLSGYDQHWSSPEAYLGTGAGGGGTGGGGTGAGGGLHYPGFSASAVRWLVERRGIGALGTDTMGIDPGADATFAANRLLLGERRIHLENLRGLGELPASGAWLIVGGVRPRRGSGSPATVFGLIP
jgi:kynurenine formamidase